MNFKSYLDERINEISSNLNKDERTYVINYLDNFGYLDDIDIFAFDLEQEIRKIQSLFGLEPTGFIDADTFAILQVKRCGCKDNNFKRAVNLWNRPVKYFIEDAPYIDGKKDTELLDYVMRESFARWQAVCAFPSIERVSSRQAANYYVDTRTGSRNNFDGPSGTLAYATLGMTNQSICFFDGDENFTVEKSGGIKILNVATHEVGHSLFLDHSRVKGALMAPTYSSRIGHPQQNDDIPRAQAGYGPPKVAPKPKPEPKPEPEPTPEPQPEPKPTPAGYTQIFIEGDVKNVKIDGFRVYKMS